MPRTFPDTLLDFQRMFPDEAACVVYLEELRWPEGFACPSCGRKGEPFRFANRTSVLRCRACRHNTRLTAGTVMHATRTPLQAWFWAAYLVTAQTPGMSALQFQRQLGVARYETAFQMLHKLRAAMVRPDRDRIGGAHAVEIDECYVGGRTRGEGRGVHHKATVVGAVEVRLRKDSEERTAKWKESHEGGIPIKKLLYAGRLRLKVVFGLPSKLEIFANPSSGRGTEILTKFVTDNVAVGSTVRTDGWRGYGKLNEMGYHHGPLVMRGDPDKAEAHLPMIHLVFSNLKTWISGTHHGVSQQHLQAYLNEYVFRFNRRFYPMGMFNSVLGIATRIQGPTYAALYDGKWSHPNP